MNTGAIRRTSLLVLLPLLLGGACGGGDPRGAPGTGRARNLVVVMLDTLRPDRLGCYGGARATSPGLDALARECVRFDAAQSASSWTAPALLSMMTSLDPDVHGILGSPIPGRMSGKITTLAEVLDARGYDTCAYTEGGYAKGGFGLDQGFDAYPDWPADLADEYHVTAQQSRIAENVDRSIEWLRARGDRPFFLFFHTYEVHSPYRAPEEWVRRMRPDYDEAAERERARTIVATWNRERRMALEDWRFLSVYRLRTADLPAIEGAEGLARSMREQGASPEEVARSALVVERIRDLYDGCILHADAHVARLVEALRALGRMDDTVLVIVSDHGEGLGDHGELEHGGTLYQSLLRVLLMIRAPGLEPRAIPDVVSLLDVAPTALDLLGIDRAALPFQQGTSLAPRLVAAASLDVPRTETPAFSHGRTMERAQDHLVSVRRGRWHLVHDRAGGGSELYDLDADPGETQDLAAGRQDIVTELRALLERRRGEQSALREALAAPPGPARLDPGTLRDLRGLGYVGDGDK